MMKEFRTSEISKTIFYIPHIAVVRFRDMHIHKPVTWQYEEVNNDVCKGICLKTCEQDRSGNCSGVTSKLTILDVSNDKEEVDISTFDFGELAELSLCIGICDTGDLEKEGYELMQWYGVKPLNIKNAYAYESSCLYGDKVRTFKMINIRLRANNRNIVASASFNIDRQNDLGISIYQSLRSIRVLC